MSKPQDNFLTEQLAPCIGGLNKDKQLDSNLQVAIVRVMRELLDLYSTRLCSATLTYVLYYLLLFTYISLLCPMAMYLASIFLSDP